MGYMKSFLKVDRFGSSSRSRGGGRSYGGVKFSVNEGVIELNVKNIESMMTENPEMRARLMEVVKADMLKARNAVVRNMSGIFKNGDPMEARRSVRRVVYEEVLGGNLNILNMQRGTASWKYLSKEKKVQKNPHMVGGNRRKKSPKTYRMEGYEGKARGMILRWVNKGTNTRDTKYGNRGAISSRNFFGPIAGAALNVVSQHLAAMIEEKIVKMYNDNNNQ